MCQTIAKLARCIGRPSHHAGQLCRLLLEGEELIAITRMAMAADPADRYESMLAMIEDLRAYLEGHVVRAYEAGLLAEIRKWIVRNRVLASTIGAAPTRAQLSPRSSDT